MRYPLVDGFGNFGSVDDDPPADAQHTEVRRTPLGHELGRFPNLLVNGAGGVPPHNLREVVAALVDGAELPGPDFPTGGVLLGDPREIYRTGRGTLRLRARAHAQDGRTLVITELPYGTSKGGTTGVIGELAGLIAMGRLPEVDDIQDHTHREGMRVLVALRRGASPEAVLERLWWEPIGLEVTIDVDLGGPLDELLARYAHLDHDELRRIADEHGDARRTTLAG
jgi:DNA gyrase subunit A